MVAYFANTGAVIFGKPALYLIDCWANFCKLCAIDLLGFGAHAGDRQDLSVLDTALLQLAEQDAESYKTVSGAVLPAHSRSHFLPAA